MLNICIWWWGTKYDWSYVEKLVHGFDRHMSGERRMVLVTDNAPVTRIFNQVIPIEQADRHLLLMKGCLARLRMFDVAWQKEHGFGADRLASVDLDTVVTGDLDPVFNRQEETFCILQGANSANPCPYTGALFMLKAGEHRDVWDDFSVEAVTRLPFYAFPDDQNWLAHKIPNAAGWRAGEGGVYAFMKPGWPHKHGELPADARLVTFPGARDPSQFKSLSWVQKHWT